MREQREQQAPREVTCPYCKGPAPQLRGELSRPMRRDRTRYGCPNGHYFTYPASIGMESVTPRREA